MDYFKLLAEKFLTTAKYSVDFKKWIYSECFEERYGDYYMPVKELLEKNEQREYEFWGIEEAQSIQDILDAVQNIDEGNNEEFTEPMVFIPFVEDINIDSLLEECPVAVPDAVISMEYDTTTRDCIGYTLNSSDQLYDFANNIDEVYAWSHDLWVFGQEENIQTGTDDSQDYQEVQSDRHDGIAEYGGIIQVTHIGAIEKWTSGKLELKYFVFSQSGIKIKEKEFGKTKRKKFKDSKWVDYNDFICYWNLANISHYMVEAWLEVDRPPMGSTTINQNYPTPCQGCPSTSISYVINGADDNMGQSIVQFTDPYSTVYGISHANFKRKKQ